VTIEEIVTDNHTSKFDLLFSAHEDEHGFRLSTGYSADLFKPATIERLVRQLAFTTKTMATEPDMRLDHYVRRLIQLETEYQQSRQAEFKHASRQRLQLNRKKDHRGASTP
jgi:non-ribosomal peptide synthetase component F